VTPRGAWWGGHPGVGSVLCLGVPVAAASAPSSGSEHDPARLFPVPAGKGWVPASFPVCVTATAPQQPAIPCRVGGEGSSAPPGMPPWLAGSCDPAPLLPGPTTYPLPEEDGGVSRLGRLAPTEV